MVSMRDTVYLLIPIDCFVFGNRVDVNKMDKFTCVYAIISRIISLNQRHSLVRLSFESLKQTKSM